MKFKMIVVYLLALGLQVVSSAPQQRPKPGSVIVPTQKEIESTTSVKELISHKNLNSQTAYGYIRIWNFTDGNPEHLAIGLQKKRVSTSLNENSEATFVWLARGMVRAEMKSYNPASVGSYQLIVSSEKIQKFTGSDEENKPLTTQDNLIKDAPLVDISTDTYLTIILTGSADHIQITQIKDSDIPMQSKYLRVINLTKEYKPSVMTVDGGKKTEIWREVSGNFLQTLVQSKNNSINCEVAYKKSSGSIVSKPLEMSFSGARSVTIVIHYDRYGRFACRSVPDAPGS